MNNLQGFMREKLGDRNFYRERNEIMIFVWKSERAFRFEDKGKLRFWNKSGYGGSYKR
jgi:hypothetical protein